MTYNDIKQRIYDILQMPVEEALRLQYVDKIPRIINEALFRVAHSVLPNLREYTVILSRKILPAKLSMPPDFISFADEQNAYLNGKQFLLENFVGNDSLILTGEETKNEYPHKCLPQEYNEYHIFYNALYPKLIDGGVYFEIVDIANEHDGIPIDKDNYQIKKVYSEAPRTGDMESYEIPDLAAMLVPHYVAGQLLVLDDKVRSIEEMNEFETLLATINTTRKERPRSYHSSKGWY